MKHSVLRKQNISKMCFVCGEKNAFGLHARFYETTDNQLVAIINPTEEHQGYPGRMHGGIATTILDETIARSICTGKDEQLWGVTMELKTRFLKPVPLGQDLKVVGRVTSEGTRTFEGSGEILLPGGEVAVSAQGKYIKLAIDKIASSDFMDDQWFYSENPDDPSEIDLP
jgi:uncharacterized protein (TIGR00369 family)